MKLLKRILLCLGIAAIASHSVYLTVRVHNLDVRLRATDLRLGGTSTGPLQINRLETTSSPQIVPTEPPIEERLRILEDDLQPRMRLLGESTGR